MRQKEERYFCEYLAERENKKRKSGILETEKSHHITSHSLALGLGTWELGLQGQEKGEFMDV